MAQGNIEKFAAMLRADEGLRAQLEAAVREHGDDADARRAFEATVGAISAGVGLPITYDDALAAYEESQSWMELSDDMLEGVVGGVGFYQAVVGAALGFTLFVSAVPTMAYAEPAQDSSYAAIEYVQDLAQGEDAQVADGQKVTGQEATDQVPEQENADQAVAEQAAASQETTDQATGQANADQEAPEQAIMSQEVTDMAPAQAMAEQSATFSFSSLMPVPNERDLTGKLVTFNDYQWIVIEDNANGAARGTITLLAADMSFGRSVYHETKNDYNQSKIKAYLDRVVAGTAGEGKPDFSKVAGAMRDTEYGKLYLLSFEEAKKIPIPGRDIKDSWWLRTPGTIPYSDCSWVMGVHNGGFIDMVGSAPELDYGIRPALQLDLDKVNFEVEWRTFWLR